MNRKEYEKNREYLLRIEKDAMCVTEASILRMELSKGFDSDELDAAKKAALAGERTCCDCHGTGTVVSYEVGSGGDVAVEPCRCAGEEKANG